MITFNNAILLVRKTFERCYITEGFEYDNEYVFDILSHNYKSMDSNQSQLVSVNKSTGEVEYFDLSKAFKDLENFKATRSKGISIDKIEDV